MVSRSRRNPHSVSCRDSAVALSVGRSLPGVDRCGVVSPGSCRKWSTVSQQLGVGSEKNGSFSVAEMLSRIGAEGVNVDILQYTIGDGVMPIHSASSLRPSQGNPIGVAVAGSPETFRLHQGLQQSRPITVALLPVSRKLPRTSRQNRAGQSTDANPRKDQKPGIIDNE